MGSHTQALTTLAVIAATALGTMSCSRGQAQSSSQYRAVATVDDIMDGIVIPASETIFDAVVYANGELVQSPKTDDDWVRVRVSAMAVAESGNLLMMPPRATDAGEWAAFSRAMTDAAVKVADAAEAKDLEGVLRTGGEMYTACAGCHEKYLPDDAQ